MQDLLSHIRWNDAVDIVLVAVLVWTAISWLRRTRSRLAIVGIVFLSGIYLVARQLELQLTVWILQGFSAVLVIALVVIFQDDLRRLFEQVAVWGLRRRAEDLPRDAVAVLVRAVEHHARTRTGAIYVLPGRRPLEPSLEGGVELDAAMSEPLLLSLFDTNTPGHDGAVVLNGSRLSRFGVHLPLSANHAEVGQRGTRHAAALGLAERTDALAVVVSEERGTVSVAYDGKLRPLASPAFLDDEVRSFLAKTAAVDNVPRSWRQAFRRWPEGLASLALAFAVWLVLVPGSAGVEVERSAEVVVENLPGAQVLTGVEPTAVRVVLRGPRLLIPAESERLLIRIEPDPGLLELGRRTFPIFPSQVEVPPRLTVVGVSPDQIRLSLEPRSGS